MDDILAKANCIPDKGSLIRFPNTNGGLFTDFDPDKSYQTVSGFEPATLRTCALPFRYNLVQIII